MDTDRGKGDTRPPYGDWAPGAGHKGLANGRAWLWMGLSFALGVMLAPGNTPGDKLRRSLQTTLWVWGAMILIAIIVLTTGALVDALVGWGG